MSTPISPSLSLSAAGLFDQAKAFQAFTTPANLAALNGPERALIEAATPLFKSLHRALGLLPYDQYSQVTLDLKDALALASATSLVQRNTRP